MQFGFFDDQRREYVITSPRTPLPWINYLGSEDFFTLLSNTAGGYCFYRDARLRRLTRYRYNNCPVDQEGFHIYIKDGDTVWNPGWQPAKTELDRYTCRHGLGYSVIEGQKNGVSAAQTLLVPQGDNCLLIRLTLKNGTAAEKTLDVFPYVEFCLWDAMDDGSNFQRNFSIGEVELEPDAIYHKSEYRERRDHYAVLWANRPYDGFDTARDAVDIEQPELLHILRRELRRAADGAEGIRARVTEIGAVGRRADAEAVQHDQKYALHKLPPV